MGKSPAFQFYPQDFLVGVMGMTDEEVGVYIKMLAIQWVKGALPSDLKALRAVIGSRKVPTENVLSKFNQSDDGMLRNSRLEEERAKQEAFRESRIASANTRWHKQCTRNARAYKTQYENDALQSSSSSSSSDESSKELSSERKRFVKPTVDQVAAYCEERDNFVDAVAFVNHYESKGWKIGSGPMKDWQAAVRTWEAKHKPPASRVPTAEDLANYNPIDGGLRR